MNEFSLLKKQGRVLMYFIMLCCSFYVMYIVPMQICCFMQIFKMWNKELYVREQQDAYEFFTSLVDQLDEHLKVKHTQTSQ